jgi:hypothetical protein
MTIIIFIIPYSCNEAPNPISFWMKPPWEKFISRDREMPLHFGNISRGWEASSCLKSTLISIYDNSIYFPPNLAESKVRYPGKASAARDLLVLQNGKVWIGRFTNGDHLESLSHWFGNDLTTLPWTKSEYSELAPDLLVSTFVAHRPSKPSIFCCKLLLSSASHHL